MRYMQSVSCHWHAVRAELFGGEKNCGIVRSSSYRCLRCFNYDLCQSCFFTGEHAKKHDGSHPIEEYCKQVTPFEDLKAFLEFVKLKVGKRELRRKERYLSIERSKSL